MRVALVYDRANKLGGAERILATLHRLYPEAPLYTLVCNEQTAPWTKGFQVIPTFFNKVHFLRTRHELLAPFSAIAFETFDLSSFDIVISITSAEAKAVITKPGTFHICYCLTPTRYLWSGTEEYRRHFPVKSLFDFYLKNARQSDLVYANRPDIYISTSKEIQKRVTNYYQKKSEVIYPPINYSFFNQIHQPKKGDYYLVVSRLVPYKRIDIAIEAFNQLNKHLIIVGTGSEEKELKKIAKDNIEFTGVIDDSTLRKYYAKAQALIFPQVEDFGLTPLEAAATGTPTLAFGSGGVVETVTDLYTGLFFSDQTAPSIIDAVRRFESGHHHISSRHCHEKALEFSEDRFARLFSAKVKQSYETYCHRWGTGKKDLAA